MIKPFIHEDKNWKELIQIVSDSKKILPTLIEKDYWIMHTLWSLSNSALSYFMKGGTSLSKAYRVIDRFSEDIDLLIEDESLQSQTARKDTSPRNVEKRRQFFDGLTTRIQVPGAVNIERRKDFDSDHLINAGIVILYNSSNQIEGVKSGILLEIGFDKIEPWEEKNISSWIIDHLEKNEQLNDFFDNRAVNVRCYRPEYTFVEKLQAISTKYRQLAEGLDISNFARHYYDVHKLLELPNIQKFIGSEKYIEHKNNRFKSKDEKDLTKNEAFLLSDPYMYKQIEDRYENTKALYYGKIPLLQEIIAGLKPYLSKM
ncbi:nucleotidyl transferase AbiEii/AbiGii toxin family protein [Leptospira alstonii]|uniref:Nucleotidyl transferase, PF08843 family n=2 Tax=Leptospira alstonii TaxID=28452 RepID=M6D197_9LEPT|nr:nucleotidyl transferase AbiEii/AbiGii toxin family protein [Leptospira alstonii]EMJ94933.1 nucleotidyl transferase, PF08843 family [Leptospira alstonii serovar Sichuan str. 79601]EQA80626.1 nucleotidyl transferase, PF08843 family [Leptospira alstonii serovar Pingchang str. 80-412]